MLNAREAVELAKLITEPDIFPEAREQFTQLLFGYYKDLLVNTPVLQIPTPRRWVNDR